MMTSAKTNPLNLAADGQIHWVGDSQHAGCDVYYSERRRNWIVVSLDPVHHKVTMSERLVIYAIRDGAPVVDNDENGLNQMCVACDLDGAGYWVVACDFGDDMNPDHQDVELIWDSADAAE